jgi:hypothetical protein
MSRTARLIARGSILLAIVCLTACGDDAPTTPGVQPEIINNPDNFEYQVTDISNYSATTSYTWQNTGPAATVDHSTTVTGGTATLVILDANETQVYSRSLAQSGSYPTVTGVAGDWTVRIVYDGASATVNFRVQKATP